MESVEATIRKVAVVDEMVEIETEIESKSYSWLYKDTYIHRTEQEPAVLQEKPTWKSELDVHVQKVLIDPPRRSSAYSIDQSASVHESKAYYLNQEKWIMPNELNAESKGWIIWGSSFIPYDEGQASNPTRLHP